MSTKTEKRLMVLSNKCAKLKARKVEAASHRKSTDAIHSKHVEAMRQLLKAELRAERKSA